MYIKNKSSLTY